MVNINEVSSTIETTNKNRDLRHQYGKSKKYHCFLCEKPLDIPACYIHVCLCCNTVLAKGERCPTGYDEDGDGGCGLFPVGSSCAKRLPKEYKYDN